MYTIYICIADALTCVCLYWLFPQTRSKLRSTCSFGIILGLDTLCGTKPEPPKHIQEAQTSLPRPNPDMHTWWSMMIQPVLDFCGSNSRILCWQRLCSRFSGRNLAHLNTINCHQLPSTATHQGSHTCFHRPKGHGSSSMAPIHLLLASLTPQHQGREPHLGVPPSHLLGGIEHAFDASKGYQDCPKKNQINDLGDPRIQEQSCSANTFWDLRPENRRTHIW